MQGLFPVAVWSLETLELWSASGNEVNSIMIIFGFLVVCRIQLLPPTLCVPPLALPHGSVFPVRIVSIALLRRELSIPFCIDVCLLKLGRCTVRKCEHEDLGLHPEHPCKRLGMVTRVCHCSTGCWGGYGRASLGLSCCQQV